MSRLAHASSSSSSFLAWLMTLAFSLPNSLLPTASAAKPLKPNIVYILVDDWGWADVGYHRAQINASEIQTPNIDRLVKEGVELDRFYAHKICSPSRCAIQTGRHPIHVNVQNVVPECSNPKDTVAGYQGIPPNMTGIASVLKRGGYSTHMVGKWDVGMATQDHHPKARGYDSWLGYWHHSNDYWTHEEGKCKLGTEPMRDLWRYNATHDGPAFDLANGKHCSQNNQSPKGRGEGENIEEERCVYEEQVFRDEAINIVRRHARQQRRGEAERQRKERFMASKSDINADTTTTTSSSSSSSSSSSLFLFWSLHLVHYPLQVPDAYLERFPWIDDDRRRSYHAMVAYLDEEIGMMASTLKEEGLWNNTLLIVHSDNGGEILLGGTCGGNNWPLTGGKFSNWEGGIRVNAFMAGGVIPEGRQGAKEQGYVAAWDMYATLAGLADEDPTDVKAMAAGLPPIDSIDVWGTIMGENSSIRTEVAIGDTAALGPNGDGKALVGGIIRGKHKLIVGAKDKMRMVDQYVQTGPSWPNRTSGSGHTYPLAHAKHCGITPKDGCLFDIHADPRERHNIAAENPDVFRELLGRVDTLQTSVFSPVRGKKDPKACEVANKAYGGYWGPFISEQSSSS